MSEPGDLLARARAAYQRRDLDEAEALCRRLLEVAPDNTGALALLGGIHTRRGEHGEAAKRLAAAVAAEPFQARFHKDLGMALRELGRAGEAAEALEKAVELAPEDAGSLQALGNLHLRLRRFAKAEACFRRIIALQPASAEAYVNLGVAEEKQSRIAAAVADYQEACRLEPGFYAAVNNLAGLLKNQGRAREAIAAYREALEVRPGDAQVHSNLVFALNYGGGHDGAALLAEHRAWAARHEAPHAAGRGAHENDPDPERRLRVGYVSPDFRQHPVAYFIGSILAQHDRRLVQVVCYSATQAPDALTERFKSLAGKWRDIARLPAEEAARQVREDGIDILVDLAGHTAHNSLEVFAAKPAPVQVSYLGYPNTTGLEAIDYRFTDRWADPPGASDEIHSEALVRLAGGFLAYLPPADLPEPAVPPAIASGRVTFGSFNNLAKLSDETVAAWSRLLSAVPDSRLFLKAHLLADEGTRAHVAGRFAGHGIEAARLELMGRIPSGAEHLAAYGRIDIGLDPFPYNGATTTCEALWMGVPVVALAGELHAGRVGVSVLNAAGLDGLIAPNVDDYVDLGVALAGDVERLARMRRELRPRLEKTPLGDVERLTRAIEAAYGEMWRRWCAARQG